MRPKRVLLIFILEGFSFLLTLFILASLGTSLYESVNVVNALVLSLIHI